MFYNKVVLVGRLTRNPDIRSTPSGVRVMNFTLAVDRAVRDANNERKTDFIRIVAWRRLVDVYENILTKGKLILVEGSIQSRNYEKNTGERINIVEVNANLIRILERRQNNKTLEDSIKTDELEQAPEFDITEDIPDSQVQDDVPF